MEQAPFLIERTEGVVVTLTLNRPEFLNSYDLEMLVQLRESVVRVSEREDVKVLVLTGNGGAFCSGARLSTLLDLLDGGDLRTLRRWLEVTRETLFLLNRSPQFCIASINGLAIDGGCNLALAADYLVAAEPARLGYPFLELGLSPEVGTASLIRARLGASPIPDLLLSGRLVGAPEAVKLGLIHEQVDSSKLHSRTRALAAWAAGLPPVVFRSLKRNFHALGQAWESTTTAEIESRIRCFLSQDFQEGLHARRERRAPRFRGG
jgi:2-(1,2-epoxy-1,2-dihydrophenyl)acetyl-CoA isomerase